MIIREASGKEMLTVRDLFCEYRDWLGVDLCFQGFEEELETLPGRYAAPRGFLLLADQAAESVGCVGVRPRDKAEAELKRLYVRESHRGLGIGRQLFAAAMSRARMLGYASVVLDTLPTMHKARSLYQAHGFKQIPAYYENPEEGAEYYRYGFS